MSFGLRASSLRLMSATTFLVAAAATACAVGQIQYQTQELTAGTGDPFDSFGYGVSISGDTAIVGAPDVMDNGRAAGAAYVFRRDASNIWNRVATLSPVDTILRDNFGTATAIDGHTAIVTAGGQSVGAAYVFHEDTLGNWTQIAKLTASNPGERLSWSVAVSNENAIVGAQYDNGGAGAAYIFHDNGGGNWAQTAKLTPPDGAFEDFFGWSVDIDGPTAVVGAWGHDLGSTREAGAAYVFHQDNLGNWSGAQEITADAPDTSDFFGQSVAVSGSTVLIGALRDDNVQGSAYVFQDDGTGHWNQTARLADDDPTTYIFGQSVAIDGNTALVGILRGGLAGDGSGLAKVFQKDGGGHWQYLATLAPTNGSTDDEFGYFVGLDGTHAVVGAPRRFDSGIGSAYIFDNVPEPATLMLVGIAASVTAFYRFRGIMCKSSAST